MVTIDWGNTNIITIPRADLTLVNGTLYELDVDHFRRILRDLEDDADGMAFPKTHNHNTETTIAGTTFARLVEILNPYSVKFEDGQYSVRLVGANNNISDVQNGVLVQNQVQVIPGNSAGLIVVNQGSGLSTEQARQLEDIYTRLGLNANDPFTDTPSQMSSQSGDIVVDLTGDGVNTTTQTRQ